MNNESCAITIFFEVLFIFIAPGNITALF